MAATIPANNGKLPVLREDLQLLEGPPASDGAPTWVIFDPVRNKYFRIGWTAFQLLTRWSLGQAATLLEAVLRDTTCRLASQDIEAMVRFLYANSLTREPATGSGRAYLEQYRASRQHWALWLVQHYLFVRIPLVHPDRFLRATVNWLDPLFSTAALIILLVLGTFGTYLAARQWDEFFSTFVHFFTLEGIALYGVALIFVKVLHELGHAYTATRFGCRVPTMGVALLVLFPVLYTDTTDAWRLRSRHQRLAVGCAGMVTELAVAALATLAWSFMSDGVLRSVAFVVATTSWVVTLVVNLNPLMRFDGYYILSDWLGVENLQERSFALGRWRLRRMLLGVDEPAPERLSASLQTWLIVFSWAVWVYRLFVFLAIALLVYHFFFKLLGLVLFSIEIAWFIVLPISRELLLWAKFGDRVTTKPRFWMTCTVLLAIVLMMFIPWSTQVRIPAIVESSILAGVHAPFPGSIDSLPLEEGSRVIAGDVLLTLVSPELDSRIEQALTSVQVLELRARRLAASREELNDVRVVLPQLEAQTSSLAGLRRTREQLIVTAPIDGIVRDVASDLHVGRWINPDLEIALVVGTGSTRVTGLVAETELARLDLGQDATFYPEDPRRAPLAGRLSEIAAADSRYLEILYVASTYGGGVAARRDDSDRLVAESGVYRVLMTPSAPGPEMNQVVRGTLHVESDPQSIVKRIYRLWAAVLIRESGF